MHSSIWDVGRGYTFVRKTEVGEDVDLAGAHESRNEWRMSAKPLKTASGLDTQRQDRWPFARQANRLSFPLSTKRTDAGDAAPRLGRHACPRHVEAEKRAPLIERVVPRDARRRVGRLGSPVIVVPNDDGSGAITRVLCDTY